MENNNKKRKREDEKSDNGKRMKVTQQEKSTLHSMIRRMGVNNVIRIVDEMRSPVFLPKEIQYKILSYIWPNEESMLLYKRWETLVERGKHLPKVNQAISHISDLLTNIANIHSDIINICHKNEKASEDFSQLFPTITYTMPIMTYNTMAKISKMPGRYYGLTTFLNQRYSSAMKFVSDFCVPCTHIRYFSYDNCITINMNEASESESESD